MHGVAVMVGEPGCAGEVAVAVFVTTGTIGVMGVAVAVGVRDGVRVGVAVAVGVGAFATKKLHLRRV